MEKAVSKIGLNQSIAHEFVLKKNEEKAVLKFSMSKTKEEFKELPLETFRVIKDWRHYAVLELIKLEDFIPSLDYICDALDLSEKEAKLIVDRLEKVGLLDKSNKKWVDTSEGFSTHVLGLKLLVVPIDSIKLNFLKRPSLILKMFLFPIAIIRRS